jgi:hypothetical protein
VHADATEPAGHDGSVPGVDARPHVREIRDGHDSHLQLCARSRHGRRMSASQPGLVAGSTTADLTLWRNRTNWRAKPANAGRASPRPVTSRMAASQLTADRLAADPVACEVRLEEGGRHHLRGFSIGQPEQTTACLLTSSPVSSHRTRSASGRRVDGRAGRRSSAPFLVHCRPVRDNIAS